MFRIFLVMVCLGTAVWALPSCIAVGGTEDEHRPTTGQELVDLKAALDKGAMTQAEYDAKKTQILGESDAWHRRDANATGIIPPCTRMIF